MKPKLLVVLLLLAATVYASDEKDQKKALESQAKELVQQAKELEQSGELVEARKSYANSQAFWETKDAEKAVKRIDEEIRKRVKDALKQAKQLYDHGKFQAASETLTTAQQLGSFGAVLAYDQALCNRQLGDTAMALGFLDEAILATVDPKRVAKLKQMRTVWTTGVQPPSRTDVVRDRILYANQLIENIGFDASLEDESPTLHAESQDAAPVVTVAENKAPKDAPSGHTHANAKAHQTASLCKSLAELKAANNDSPSLTFDLANCAEDNGRLKESSQLLNRYLELAPNATDAARTRQRIADINALLELPEEKRPQVQRLYASATRALEERKFDRAMADFQKAKNVAPDFAPTQWRIALMYEAMGNVDQAKEYFTNYRQSETNADAQTEADVHLRNAGGQER